MMTAFNPSNNSNSNHRLYLSRWMFILFMLPLMTACSSDDDDIFSIDSYIIGFWHSYKAIGYTETSESATFDIDKTGPYSAAYWELTFSKDNKMKLCGWLQDDNGISHWVEDLGTYSIKDNIVTITDSEGGTVDLLFDYNAKTLMIRTVTTVDGRQITVNIYLKK